MKQSDKKISKKQSKSLREKLSKKQWMAVGIATVVLCSAAGAGLAAWQTRNEGKGQEAPDEVAQIENLNSRDNVADESTAFEGERASHKDKKEAEKAEAAAAKKKADSEGGKSTAGGSDGQGNQDFGNQDGQTGNEGSGEGQGGQSDSDNDGDTDAPENPDEQEDVLPQIPEPGWTTGIY